MTVLPVKAIHESDVDEDQRDKDVNRSLLGEPESELETGDLYSIELVHEENPATKGRTEPNCEKDRQVAEIPMPVDIESIAAHGADDTRLRT
jgi:hypothetical protein